MKTQLKIQTKHCIQKVGVDQHAVAVDGNEVRGVTMATTVAFKCIATEAVRIHFSKKKNSCPDAPVWFTAAAVRAGPPPAATLPPLPPFPHPVLPFPRPLPPFAGRGSATAHALPVKLLPFSGHISEGEYLLWLTHLKLNHIYSYRNIREFILYT